MITLESCKILEEILRKHNIYISHPKSSARMIDKLISFFIEPKCIQPTFLFAYPLIMSPLAREQNVDQDRTEEERVEKEGIGEERQRRGLVDRFELVVGKQELVNAYSELSDPDEQRRRFQLQAQQRLEVSSNNFFIL